MGEIHPSEPQALPPAPMPMPVAIWRILYNRGLRTPEAIGAHLNPKLKDLTHPFALDDMEKSAARVVQAVKAGEPICIYADFDLDGTSGAALLERAFRLLEIPNCQVVQPKRLSDGYGFHAHLIPEMAQQGVKLIITVDVGITAFEAVEAAKQHGIDVIITDHHLPENRLPEAFAIVNPNKGDCPSGLGHLCGAGVAFYLAMALKIALGKKDVDLKVLLDCFVVGTLTDMVPLVRENRILTRHGLHMLSQTGRPGLRALLDELGLSGRVLNAQEVAIRFAPKLNALSRMEKTLMPLQVFQAESAPEARTMVSEIMACNELRVKLQKQAEEVAFDLARAQKPERFVWVWSEQFHRGVVGLVATKLAQEYGLPAFVGSVQSNGQIVGSGRLGEGLPISLLEILQSASQHLVRFGGHRQACGFELKASEAQNLYDTLDGCVPEVEVQASEWRYDASLEISEINPQLMQWLESLGPFGSGFEVPRLYLPQLELKTIRKLGKGQHLKLSMGASSGGPRVDALWFSPPAGHELLKNGLNPGMYLDLLAEAQWNHYKGQREIQLLIREVRSSLQA